MSYQLPPAAAIVSQRNAKLAIALPILWHAVTLARSYQIRSKSHPFWLALDVIGTAWSLIPVAQAVQPIIRKELASANAMLRLMP